MLLYPSIDELKKKVDSRYTLCALAARRAKNLTDGMRPLDEEEEGECNKISIAASEISEDLITYRRVENAGDDSLSDVTFEDDSDEAEDSTEAAENAAEEAAPDGAGEEPADEEGADAADDTGASAGAMDAE